MEFEFHEIEHQIETIDKHEFNKYDKHEFNKFDKHEFNKFENFLSNELENILDIHDYLQEHFPFFFRRSEYFVSFIIDFMFNTKSVKCNNITEQFVIEYFEEIDTTLQIVNNYLKRFKVKVSKQIWMYFCYKLYKLNNNQFSLTF
jgi:hypothetical protein